MENVSAPSMAASSSREGSATSATALDEEGSDDEDEAEEGGASTSMRVDADAPADEEEEEEEEDGADEEEEGARTPLKMPIVTARGVCCSASGSGSRSSDEWVTMVRTDSKPVPGGPAPGGPAATLPPLAAAPVGAGSGRNTTLVSGLRKARKAAIAANNEASMALPPV